MRIHWTDHAEEKLLLTTKVVAKFDLIGSVMAETDLPNAIKSDHRMQSTAAAMMRV